VEETNFVRTISIVYDVVSVALRGIGYNASAACMIPGLHSGANFIYVHSLGSIAAWA
jgi:hypothetical protein